MSRPPTPPRRCWADAPLLAILVAGSAWLSLTLARGPGELSGIWIGSGLLAGWLLKRPTRHWPGYVAATFVADAGARLLVGDAPGYALVLASCNATEALLLAGIVRRHVPDVSAPKDWLAMGGLATAATLLACALSGTVAAAVAHLLHGQDFRMAFLGWYAAHVVGMVIVVTTTLVMQRGGLGLFLEKGRRGSLVATMALLVAVAVTVFLTSLPLLFLAYPPLLLVATRHDFAGVALGVIVLGLVGGIATHLGYGPLWLQEGLGDQGRIALLQIFLAGGCLMTIPMCLATAERNRLTRHLADSERRYRMLADHSHDVIARIRADGERLYVSPSVVELLGWQPAQMLGSRWDLIHPDDRPRQQQAMAEVLDTGHPRTDVYRLRHRDGHHVWVEGVARCLPADDDANALDVMLSVRDITLRKEAEEALAESRRELERMSRTDPLTGLANRRQLEERLAQALARLGRGGPPVALLYLDVDHFKQVNDSLGHAAGDALLREFARRLRESVRVTDLVARPGGDEFVMLLEDPGPAGAETVARKVLEATQAPIEAEGTALVVGTSIGIACARRPVESASLMARADAALYVAKRAGRNRYHVDAGG